MKNIEEINFIHLLSSTAVDLKVRWEEREAVNWSEAEEFVDLIGQLPQSIITNYPDVAIILDYANACDEWDSSEVARWPYIIIRFTESYLQAS